MGTLPKKVKGALPPCRLFKVVIVPDNALSPLDSIAVLLIPGIVYVTPFTVLVEVPVAIVPVLVISVIVIGAPQVVMAP